MISYLLNTQLGQTLPALSILIGIFIEFLITITIIQLIGTYL